MSKDLKNETVRTTAAELVMKIEEARWQLTREFLKKIKKGAPPEERILIPVTLDGRKEGEK